MHLNFILEELTRDLMKFPFSTYTFSTSCFYMQLWMDINLLCLYNRVDCNNLYIQLFLQRRKCATIICSCKMWKSEVFFLISQWEIPFLDPFLLSMLSHSFKACGCFGEEFVVYILVSCSDIPLHQFLSLLYTLCLLGSLIILCMQTWWVVFPLLDIESCRWILNLC